jgi:ADP-ribose pyrophosphatase YjhB (NUDIX family)
MINLINTLEESISDPRRGLPEELFLFASRITPLVNVDLLVKDKLGKTLLTWRDDGYYPPSWHIPGGIIRYKETFAERIKEVARTELGAAVDFDFRLWQSMKSFMTRGRIEDTLYLYCINAGFCLRLTKKKDAKVIIPNPVNGNGMLVVLRTSLKFTVCIGILYSNEQRPNKKMPRL